MSDDSAFRLATEALVKLAKDMPKIVMSGASSGSIGGWAWDYLSDEQKALLANAKGCACYISAYPCNNKQARKFWRSVIAKAIADGLV